MNKRIPLNQRIERDAAKGIDSLIQSVPEETPAAVTDKAALAKVTMYIRPEQVEAIESIQLAERKRTGKRPDKSDLAQEAIDLLIEKYRLK